MLVGYLNKLRLSGILQEILVFNYDTHVNIFACCHVSICIGIVLTSLREKMTLMHECSSIIKGLLVVANYRMVVD
jgi:Na+-translocating ferredoxin:NAD+ oxidoreductase RnfD subunit